MRFMSILRHPLFYVMVVAVVARAGALRCDWHYDTCRFTLQARALIAGDGYCDMRGNTCTSLPPGYPYFLALVLLCCDAFGLLCCDAFGFVLTVQFVLSVATCCLVYLAVKPAAKAFALIAAVLLALSPLHIRYCGFVLSETFGAFLMSLLCYMVSRSELQGARIRSAFFVGLVSVVLVLTCPGTVFVAFFLWVYLAWLFRRSCAHLAMLVAGSLAVMVPWQLHCYRARGAIEPLLLSRLPILDSGVLLWYHTWSVHWDDGNFFTDPAMCANLPDEVFSSPKQRIVLTNMNLLVHNDPDVTWHSPDVDAAFREAAAERIADDPWRFYLILPLQRSFFLWAQPDYAWERGPAALKRLGLSHVASSGWRKNTDRVVEFGAGIVGCLIWHAIPAALVVVSLCVMRCPRLGALAIVAGCVAYAWVSSTIAINEFRRSIPFFPAILCALSYYAKGIDEIWPSQTLTENVEGKVTNRCGR